MAEIKKIKTKKLTCPINDTVSIQFETDARDNFFDLHTGNGKLDYTHNIIKHQTLKTGIFNLKFDPTLDPTITVNQEINFILTISERKKEKWQYEIPIKFSKAIKKESPPSGPSTGTSKTRSPYTRKVVRDDDTDAEGLWTPPEIKTIAKDGKQKKQWEEFFGEGDKALRRGAHIEFKGQNKKIIIWINLSHPSLIKYQQKNPQYTQKKLVSRYANYIGYGSYAMYLLKEGKLIKYGEESDAKEMMEHTSDALAFFGLLYLDAAK